MNAINESSELKKKSTAMVKLLPLAYWAEEAVIPLFVLTDPKERVFKDNFLCAYSNGVCSFYYLNNRHESEAQSGFDYFNNEDNIEGYTDNVKRLVRKIKVVSKNSLSFSEVIDLLREWNDLYLLTEPARLKNFEVLNTDDFLRKFKEIGIARLEMRKVAESVLFHKIDAAIENIANIHTIDADDLFLYTFDELQKLIKMREKVSLNTIDERSHGYIYSVNKGIATFFTGIAFEKLFAQIKNKRTLQSGKILFGRGVSKGITRGKVQLILHNEYDISSQLSSFKEGNILVTEMTRPQLITICHKVKGIITNEGGILSHAAIVSREFKIPCVVGTEIATQVLRDGDLVEVDGDKGVVKLIKHAS